MTGSFQHASRKKRGGKIVNDGLDAIRKLVEQWESGFTLANPRFVERYVEGKLRIQLVFTAVTKKYVANFQGCHLLGFKHQRHLARLSKGRQGLFDKNFFIDAGDGKQKTMLVNNVKTMEFPQRTIPSLVRFEEADRLRRLTAHSLYFSSKRGFIFLGCGFLGADGELAFCAKLPSVLQDQLTHEMVKDGSQIVDCLSRDDGQIRWDIGNAFNPMHPLSGFEILLGNDSVGLRFQKLQFGRFKFEDMLVGPFNFFPDAD